MWQSIPICYINLELGLLVGTVLAIVGFGISIYAVNVWGRQHFGPLDMSHTFRLVIPAALALTLGVQAIFSSFFLSVLGLAGAIPPKSQTAS